MKRSSKQFLGLILAGILGFSSVVVYADDKTENARAKTNQAVQNKTFYNYMMAYIEILNMPDGQEKSDCLTQLAPVFAYANTPNVQKARTMLESVAKDKNGRIYAETEAYLNGLSSAQMDEYTKGYLLGELTSWGRQFVFTSDYTEAVDALIAASTKKDSDSINKAQVAISKVANENSKNYLTQELNNLIKNIGALSGRDNIQLSSTNQVAKVSSLYAVDGTGKYSGYKILKGYPNENEFLVYYQGDGNRYTVKCEDLREINLNEVISWQYNGVTYNNTKAELFNLFSDTSWFSSNLAISGGSLSQEWFTQTFGNTYNEWTTRIAYSSDAEKLVEAYFKKTTPKVNDNVTLKPDSIIKTETGLINVNGEIVFEAYDIQGNYKGTYHNDDDIYFALSEKENRPPRLSEGWISTDLLKKIYNFYINTYGNDLVIETDPFVKNHKEFLRLNLADGWLTNNNTEEIKANGVRLRKYIYGEEPVKENEQWIGTGDIYREYGVYCSIGNTIDDFVLYGPEDKIKKERPVLFEGTWPKGWDRKDNQNETSTKGLRIQRKNNYNLFNIEDLKKLNIIPGQKASTGTNVYYLNISDLQNIGLIK